MYSKGGGYGGRSPVGFLLSDELVGEPIDSVPRSGAGDSISVTVRFRLLRKFEFCLNESIIKKMRLHGIWIVPKSCSFPSATTSFYGASGNNSRSTPRSDSMYSKGGGYGGRSAVGFLLSDELVGEPINSVPRSRAGDSISVTVRFRPLSEREYHKGDEIAWYLDGDVHVRNEYNPRWWWFRRWLLVV
ncbi:putative kinesin motor domain-containing protein [Helianthus annuus]|uniref:Kinesin-like protein n=1 Tax=Helianthus annuus TaxID=4232 RepID=A0A9K3P585_HELAN|nr:putative kinesin-like protein [Helianthus annuus]KAJ0624931.1 putative kinesin motor domain-containing protein [Helianthus annuus]KAJ0628600.1 putative kinesin motor domain-containing protein [Helianthus annuus]KAJ0784929.1 putative kinesin motor domain-containing protein [Helianthus annuus]KAJ0794187.1 putative kinesin motor domain-containing protein [Helianthus annuus]